MVADALELADESLFFGKYLVLWQVRNLDARVDFAAVRGQGRGMDDYHGGRELILRSVHPIINGERVPWVILF